MTSKVIEGHKSSSNFSVNPTLPLMISPHYVSSSQQGQGMNHVENQLETLYFKNFTIVEIIASYNWFWDATTFNTIKWKIMMIFLHFEITISLDVMK